MWDEGDAATRRGEYERALACYDAAREGPDGEAHWYVHTALCCLYRGEFEAGVHRAGAGLRQRWATGAAAARLLAARALCQAAAGRVGLAEADAAQAQRKSDADPAADPATLFLVARAAGTVALIGGHAEAACEAFAAGLEVVDRDNVWARSIAEYNVAEACYEVGDLVEAHRYLDLAEASKREADDAWGLAYLHRVRALCCLAVGSIVEAIAECRLGLMFAQRAADPRIEAALLVTLGQLAALNGDFPTARQAAGDSVTLARGCGAIPELIAATLVLADADLLAGDLAEAQGRARWAIAHAEAHGLARGGAAAEVAGALASFRPTGPIVAAALRHAAGLGNPFDRLQAEVRIQWWQARNGGVPDAKHVARLAEETERRGAMRLHALCRVTQDPRVADECEAVLRLLGCDPEADQVAEVIDREEGVA